MPPLLIFMASLFTMPSLMFDISAHCDATTHIYDISAHCGSTTHIYNIIFEHKCDQKDLSATRGIELTALAPTA